MEKPKIEVKRYRIPLDPNIDIFSVEICNDGLWVETVPSEEALKWFLKGITAGASCFGNEFIPSPVIPKNHLEIGE